MGFNIDKLCLEIEGIYQALISLKVPDGKGGEKYLLSIDTLNLQLKRPAWLKSGKLNVRNCVLESYEKNEVAGRVCKTSAMYTSHVSTFDVDHFFPADEIKKKLDNLKSDNNGNTFAQLKEKLINNRVIPKNIIDQLINGENISGLNTLYYNATSNIWPMVGTINSGKGAGDPFVEAATIMLSSILKLYGEEQFKLVVQQLKSDQSNIAILSTINQSQSSDKLILDIVEMLKNDFIIDLDSESTILPRFINNQTMLEKFLQSNLVQIIGKYRYTQESLMNSTLRNLSYIDPEKVSLAQILVFRKINRSLIKQMVNPNLVTSEHASNSQNSKDSSADLEKEELPLAFKMLEIVLRSLKKDSNTEVEFVNQLLHIIGNCVQDIQLKSAILNAQEVIKEEMQHPLSPSHQASQADTNSPKSDISTSPKREASDLAEGSPSLSRQKKDGSSPSSKPLTTPG